MKQLLLILPIITILLAGCTQLGRSTPAPGAIHREETVTLPTGLPTPPPSPVSTRVLPMENFTPGPTATITPIPDEAQGLVVEIIDGDTIAVVMDGDPPGLAYQVRYLGIDTPPRTPDNPWGIVASEANRKLVGMKVVRLVRDQTDFDSEGFLLRYVYIGDQLMNLSMVEQGLARAAVTAPDTRFQKEIQEAEARAREDRLGLWGPPPTLTPTRGLPASPSPAGSPPAQPTLAVITPTRTITATVVLTPTIITPTVISPTGTETPAAPEEGTPVTPAGG